MEWHSRKLSLYFCQGQYDIRQVEDWESHTPPPRSDRKEETKKRESSILCQAQESCPDIVDYNHSSKVQQEKQTNKRKKPQKTKTEEGWDSLAELIVTFGLSHVMACSETLQELLVARTS